MLQGRVIYYGSAAAGMPNPPEFIFITNSLPSMKIDIVPLVVIVFCLGVALSALISSEKFNQSDMPLTLAQVQE
jgi:hypothetical protein